MENTHINTSSLFDSKEAYLTFIAKWKALARAKKITAADCLLRCILLGKSIDAALPVTKNALRLANGAKANSGLSRARGTLMSASPLRALAYRQECIAKHQAGGRAPSEYILQLGWSEHWVVTANRDSTENGISLATFEKAQATCATRTAE